jgi:hypothetical protein
MTQHTAHTTVSETPKGRARLEPPDLSEKGGVKGGQPQRSDARLFMQLMAFGGCTDIKAASQHLAEGSVAGALYTDVNDPRGIAVLTLSRDPNDFVDVVRPLVSTHSHPSRSSRTTRCSAAPTRSATSRTCTTR